MVRSRLLSPDWTGFWCRDWDDHFYGARQYVMPRLMSAHRSIMLDCVAPRAVRRPFHFENMWLKSDRFFEKIRDWWNDMHFQGSASFVWAKKIKHLKEQIKIWNKSEFGQLEVQEENIKLCISELDEKEEGDGLSVQDRIQQAELKRNFCKLVDMEVLSWKQKSRDLE